MSNDTTPYEAAFPPTTEERCGECGHDAREHISPAIDLGLPVSMDVCQWGACSCREYVPESHPSQGVEGETGVCEECGRDYTDCPAECVDYDSMGEEIARHPFQPAAVPPPPETAFRRIIEAVTGGCGCACHTGTGYNSACSHCHPAAPPETPEPLRGVAPCTCGHTAFDHADTQDLDLDGRPTTGLYTQCVLCVGEDRVGSAHPFQAPARTGDRRWDTARLLMRAIDSGGRWRTINALADHEAAIRADEARRLSEELTQADELASFYEQQWANAVRRQDAARAEAEEMRAALAKVHEVVTRPGIAPDYAMIIIERFARQDGAR